jgi:hypothetical protein
MAKGRWLDEDWPYRMPVYVRNSSADTTYDIEIALSSLHVHFWANVKNDGSDIRVVSPSGTLLTYDLASFDYANKTVTVEVDGFSAQAGEKVNLLWIYYGNAAAASAATTFAPSSAKTGTAPSFIDPTAAQIRMAIERPQADQTRPSNVVVKGVDEEVTVYVDVTDWLQDGAYAIEGSMGLEDIVWMTMDVEQGGVAVSSMYASVRSVSILEHSGRIWAAIGPITDGTHDNDYTGILTAFTTLSNLYQHRFLIKVYDVSEA